MDIDVSDPEKPDKNLPRTKEEALTLLEGFPLKPSYTLSSGNGVHAYWALSEEIVIETEEQRKEAQELVRAFYRGFGAFAAPFKFDATHDLSRMLRFPGSLNFKDVNNPKAVEFLTENPERLYTVKEIQDAGIEKVRTQPRESLTERLEVVLEEWQPLLEIEPITLELNESSLSRSQACRICDFINECLSNALRHGHATRVRIQVSEALNDVLVVVSNNGSPVAQTKKGLGTKIFDQVSHSRWDIKNKADGSGVRVSALFSR